MGLLALAVVGFAAAYAVLRSYLHSDSFRRFLSAEAGEMAKVTGEFTPFQWDGLAVDSDSFSATGEGTITGLQAAGLHTEVGFGGLKRGVWEIRESRARRLDLTLDSRKSSVEGELEVIRKNVEKKSSARKSWFPREAELMGIDVGAVNLRAILDSGEVTANGIRVHAEQAGSAKAFKGELEGGTVRLPFDFIPELRLDSARLRYQDGRVFLTGARVDAWQNGSLTASGEADLRAKSYSLQGDVSGIRSDDLLPENWARRLSGDVSSDFSVNNISGEPAASGTLRIRNGALVALPVLDVLAAYADTRRFRELALNEAQADWRWKKGEISLSNVVISSEGLTRLEGNLTIRGKSLDGHFRLGLAPGTLVTIPGAETDVFAAGEHGLLWAPLRITGTLDDPKEDLSDRLIAAAGIRIFEQLPETGQRVIKFTRSAVDEHSTKIIEKGVEILEKNGDVVREVGGILDGILGGGGKSDSDKK